MIAVSVNACQKYNQKRKAEKARQQCAMNPEDSSRRVVNLPKPKKTEVVRPVRGGMVQYYNPEDKGRSPTGSGSESSSDAPSIMSTSSSTIPQACQCCQNYPHREPKTSDKKSKFSWKQGWHPTQKDADTEEGRGGWPQSENLAGWRPPMNPVKDASPAGDGQSWHAIDAERATSSNVSPAELEEQDLSMGQWGRTEPEYPHSASLEEWNHFLKDVDSSTRKPVARYYELA